MSVIAPREKLVQIDQQHIKLIDELDALNQRLEQALDRFLPKLETEPRLPDLQVAILS